MDGWTNRQTDKLDRRKATTFYRDALSHLKIAKHVFSFACQLTHLLFYHVGVRACIRCYVDSVAVHLLAVHLLIVGGRDEFSY